MVWAPSESGSDSEQFMQVFVVAILLLCAHGAKGLDLSDLQGSYLAECQSLSGLPDGFRVTEYLSISDDIGYYVTFLYPDASCQLGALLRFDRIVELDLGSGITSSSWTGPTAYQSPTQQLSQRHIKKLMTPLTAEGETFLETACPSQSWTSGESTDVIDQTCAGFFYACENSDHTESTCVTQGSSNQLSFCARGTSGSCLSADRQLNYFTTATGATFQYAQRDALGLVDMNDLEGDYTQTCSKLFGLPSDWRISETASYQSDGRIHLINTVYSDTECTNVALKYDRTVQGYFGADSGYPFQTEYPIVHQLREFAQYYIEKKYTDVSTAGADFLTSLCPDANDWVPTSSINIMDIDCPPFTPACLSGDNWEYIQLGQGADQGLLRYANNPTPDWSCSPAEYSTSPYLASTTAPPPVVIYAVYSAATVVLPSFLVLCLGALALF